MFSTITRAADALSRGEVIALLDDCSPLPSLCLLKEAARVTADDVALFAVYGRGVICAALREEHRRRLGLSLMLPNSPREDDRRPFDFTVSVEARTGVTTGISAQDRATTLRALATTADPRLDLVTPGHIFPSRAHDGGVLVRAAVPEASLDLLALAGCSPVAAFIHCLSETGDFLSEPQRIALIDELNLPLTSIGDIIRYRLAHEPLVSRVAEALLPTDTAVALRAVCYLSNVDGAEHLALVHGDPAADLPSGEPANVLVRVQTESPFWDLFGMNPGRGLEIIRKSLGALSAHDPGVLVYIRHPRRNLLQRSAGQSLLPADETSSAVKGAAVSAPEALREMGVGAQILRDLGVRRATILSNSRRDFSALQAFQLEVTCQESFR